MPKRLAEVIGALSLAADLASGQASEKGLRNVVIASRLASRLALRADDLVPVFWVTALRLVGCTGFSSETAAVAAGDDIGTRVAMGSIDDTRPLEVVRSLNKHMAPDEPAHRRALAIARFMSNPQMRQQHAASRCETGVFFARSLGMSEAVASALDASEERFDGRGPRGIRGDDLPIAARISDVADRLERFAWAGGIELASSMLRKHRGTLLDPAIVDAALADAPELLAGLNESSVWDAFLACEPREATVEGAAADRAWVALGRFGDLKSTYTLTHSARVTALCEAAGRSAGLDDEQLQLLRRAASVHDLGRVAVATGTWDKRGTLNAIEWQRVRTHSHQTEAVLRGAGLDALADIAGATHERGRGAGYHKGTALDGLPFLARLVAAADVMAALGEDRPHRPAMDANRAAAELRSMAEAGALDPRAARAVLDGQGVSSARKGTWPDGLSDREVEVIRLVAVGRTNKEIGALLGMSPRTAQKHVMNVYDKLGLESRAGLALYALERGLLDGA